MNGLTPAISEETAQAERLEELRERLKQADLDLEPIDQEYGWIIGKRLVAQAKRDKCLKDYREHLELMCGVKL